MYICGMPTLGWKSLKNEIQSMASTMYFRLLFIACRVSDCSIRVPQSYTTQRYITPCPIAKSCANRATLYGTM